MKRLIIAVSLILLILIIAVIYITGRLPQSPKNGPHQEQITRPSSVPQPLTPLQKQEKQIEDVRKSSRVFSPQQLEAATRFNTEILPYQSDSFDMAYSDLLGQYFVYKKTPAGEALFETFLRENAMSSIKRSFPEMFVTTDQAPDQAIQEAEDLFFQEQQEFRRSETNSENVQGVSTATPEDRQAQTAIKLFKLIFSLGDEGGTIGEEPIALPEKFFDSVALNSLFVEAGGKLGIQPQLLSAVMQVECGVLFGLDDFKIALYSQPGKGIPSDHKCYKKAGQARGPMQFMEGTWRTYGSAINRLGGATHTPNIMNIRDSIFAAAEKLKKDSRSTGTSMSCEELRRAIICYNAGCGKLGAPPKETRDYLTKVLPQFGC